MSAVLDTISDLSAICYAMLCYAMLCYAMLCYDRNVMLCYVMLCHDGVAKEYKLHI